MGISIESKVKFYRVIIKQLQVVAFFLTIGTLIFSWLRLVDLSGTVTQQSSTTLIGMFYAVMCVMITGISRHIKKLGCDRATERKNRISVIGSLVASVLCFNGTLLTVTGVITNIEILNGIVITTLNAVIFMMLVIITTTRK